MHDVSPYRILSREISDQLEISLVVNPKGQSL